MIIINTLKFSSVCLGKRIQKKFANVIGEQERFPIRIDGDWIEVDIPMAWDDQTVRFWAKYYNLIEYGP